MVIPIRESKLLIVEGRDEVNFFTALMNYLALRGIQIIDYAGKTNLRVRLQALRNTPNFHLITSLGVVRDADTDAASAFQSVRDALESAGLAAPAQPLSPVGASPQVVVMILPPGSNQGMLEDLCMNSVARDPVALCVDSYFLCVSNQLHRLPGNLSKAKVHAFLASRDKPDLRLGEAALAGYWPWDNYAFAEVKQFLRTL